MTTQTFRTFNCSNNQSAMECAREMFGPAARLGERVSAKAAPDGAVGKVSVRAGEDFWVIARAERRTA